MNSHATSWPRIHKLTKKLRVPISIDINGLYMSITEASVARNVHYFSPVSTKSWTRDWVERVAEKQRRKNKRGGGCRGRLPPHRLSE
ncbi:hypothetical protein [Cutibacterium acnes]|uniref:hypothetical protein n=1 Tax=Cutibacterium acnes TaxID=1747 RepID=UPI0032E00563